MFDKPTHLSWLFDINTLKKQLEYARMYNIGAFIEKN
jgi:hypothetical protein